MMPDYAAERQWVDDWAKRYEKQLHDLRDHSESIGDKVGVEMWKAMIRGWNEGMSAR